MTAEGSCLLVFGISGVGKSQACADFVTRHPNWLHLSASRLLSSATGELPEALRTAQDARIWANQALFAPAVQAARVGQEARPVLIDAHAVIDNDHGLVTIPVSAVEPLRPTGLVLIDLPPGQIADRRANDSRPRPTRTLAAISEEAALERETVQGYALELGIPMVIGIAAPGFRLDPLIDTLNGLQ